MQNYLNYLLINFLKSEKAKNETIYPVGSLIFNAFEQTPFNKVKVLILGQDPYHGEGQAHGLCFSVPEGIQIPPSLQNIFKEFFLSMLIEYFYCFLLLIFKKKATKN